MRWIAAIFGTILICAAFSWYMYQAVYLPRSTVPVKQVITRTPTPPPAAPSRVPLKTPEPIESLSIDTPIEPIEESAEPAIEETPVPIQSVIQNENSSLKYVINGPVNIREKPSILGKVLLVAPNNTSLELIGEQNINNNYSWERVKLSYGVEGWIADKFLTSQKVELNEPLVEKSVIGSRVNIRSLPTTKSKIIKKATSGTRLKVFTKPIMHQGFKWVHVYLEDGQTGWAASRFLSAQ